MGGFKNGFWWVFITLEICRSKHKIEIDGPLKCQNNQDWHSCYLKILNYKKNTIYITILSCGINALIKQVLHFQAFDTLKVCSVPQ